MVTYMSTTLRAKEAMTMPVLTSSPPAITTKRWPKRLLRTVDRGAGEGESRGQHPPQQLHSHHLLWRLFSYSCPGPREVPPPCTAQRHPGAALGALHSSQRLGRAKKSPEQT